MPTPTIMYDCFDSFHKTPFGAVKQHSPCTFTLKFPRVMNITEPSIVMFRPGYKEKYVALEPTGDADPLYINYSCVYRPQDLGLHHYYFAVKQNGNRSYIKRKGAGRGAFDGTELFQLTVYDSEFDTPDWLKGGIMYQIFPDRFAKSDTAGIPPLPIDRVLHHNWHEIPEWQPDNQGRITNNDYFGGNLKGIEEKLSYLASLGVTVIYLNPVFEAHENHRYNTANYEKIDTLLGSTEDFTRFCAKARRRGIRVILDGVFSHTGADSIYFNKFGRYGETNGAFRDPNSPYRSWYSFTKYPNEYESWWGMTTLPNVNENNPDYTKYICGEGGILQKWIDAGASGWRLDVADELPDEFIDNLNKAVKAKGHENVIYGEVWEDATTKESYGVRRRYLIGGQLDSVMNYPFKEAILNYVKYGNADDFKNGIMTILEHYPKPSVDILMNFVSTHDVERAITRLAGENVGTHDRKWQSENALSDNEYVYGIALLKCAMTLQFFLPGVPCIYYGDEAGQEGYKDPFNRRTYPWGRENFDLINFTAELARIRRGCRAFEKGELHIIEATADYCVFNRVDYELGEAITIYLNKSKYSRRFKIEPAPGRLIKFQLMRSPNRQREAGYLQVSPYDFAAMMFTIEPNGAPTPINYSDLEEEFRDF
ncbi:MAG: glycoside hydrolase family 13 protein [Oscillospiraceae bacterium]|nr:glycoside hydrolase family 13 protein [Oscillospiraceae bacterium]